MVTSPVLILVTMTVACCCVSADSNIGPIVLSRRSRGGKMYKIFTALQLNYYDARNFCNQGEMELASIMSAEEQELLEAMTKATGLRDKVFWTSGNDLAQFGTFVWSRTGEPFTFTNWLKGQPNHWTAPSGEVQHCVRLEGDDHLQWNDWYCSGKGYVACQAKNH